MVDALTLDIDGGVKARAVGLLRNQFISPAIIVLSESNPLPSNYYSTTIQQATQTASTR